MTEEIYNLLIAGDDEAWDLESYILDLDRYLEYTKDELKLKFSQIDNVANAVKKLPCIFAYEDSCKKDGFVGYITDIMVRQRKIKIFFKKEAKITSENIHKLKFELDIHDWEFTRTHWAMKKVNLYKELEALNIGFYPDHKPVDISRHHFDIAFTFPGESREIVEQIVRCLEEKMSKNSMFYDNNFISQLARPDMDLLLQEIYKERANLVVVFLSGKYQEKKWCGLEFKAIRQLIMNKENSKIMFIRLDDGDVKGVFNTDGYIDGNKFTPQKMADFIKERSELQKTTSK